eukprot:2312078-Prymnesium_polylepis.1
MGEMNPTGPSAKSISYVNGGDFFQPARARVVARAVLGVYCVRDPLLGQGRVRFPIRSVLVCARGRFMTMPPASTMKTTDLTDLARAALTPVSYTHLTLPTICSV